MIGGATVCVPMDWCPPYEGTSKDVGDDSQKMANASVLVATWDQTLHYRDEHSCSCHDGDRCRPDRNFPPECSAVDMDTHDDGELRAQNGNHSYRRAATWAAGHPQSASLSVWPEIREGRARERTWATFAQSWNLPSSPWNHRGACTRGMESKDTSWANGSQNFRMNNDLDVTDAGCQSNLFGWSSQGCLTNETWTIWLRETRRSGISILHSRRIGLLEAECRPCWMPTMSRLINSGI